MDILRGPVMCLFAFIYLFVCIFLKNCLLSCQLKLDRFSFVQSFLTVLGCKRAGEDPRPIDSALKIFQDQQQVFNFIILSYIWVLFEIFMQISSKRDHQFAQFFETKKFYANYPTEIWKMDGLKPGCSKSFYITQKGDYLKIKNKKKTKDKKRRCL